MYVSDGYAPGCMQKRNRYMADRSSVCVCWLSSETGGTYYTVRYAGRMGLEIINLYSGCEQNRVRVLTGPGTGRIVRRITKLAAALLLAASVLSLVSCKAPLKISEEEAYEALKTLGFTGVI